MLSRILVLLGGNKNKHLYNKKLYTLRTTERGGKYIVVAKKKSISKFVFFLCEN